MSPEQQHLADIATIEAKIRNLTPGMRATLEQMALHQSRCLGRCQAWRNSQATYAAMHTEADALLDQRDRYIDKVEAHIYTQPE